MSSSKAVYLFCFARADLLRGNLEGQGIDKASPLRLHPHQAVAAVISDVALEDFTGPAAEAHLKDVAWLTPRALRHEHVVEDIAQRSPVFPARFGTIFSALDSLTRLMANHYETIRGFLDRTAGTEEWGLKGFLDRKKAVERIVETELASKSSQLSSSAGMRYMQERRIRAEAEGKLRNWLEETSARIRDELSPRAVRSTARKLLTSISPDTPGEMVLNLAFLLPRDEVGSFRDAGDRLARRLSEWGLVFEWAGPFPPYSFTPVLGEQQ